MGTTKNVNTPVYTVRKVKTWNGREGGGFECELLRDGKYVADCLNNADGGPTTIYFKGLLDVRAAEQTALDEFAASLPKEVLTKEKDGFDMTFQPDAESVVGGLVDDFLVIKSVKARLRRSVFVQLADGAVIRMKGPKSIDISNPQFRGRLDVRHPGNKIINEMPEQEAINTLAKVLYGKEVLA